MLQVDYHGAGNVCRAGYNKLATQIAFKKDRVNI